jgi:hypothetical protein
MIDDTYLNSPDDEESRSAGTVPADSAEPGDLYWIRPGELSLGTLGSFDFEDWYAIEFRKGYHYAIAVDGGPAAFWYANTGSSEFRFFISAGAEMPDQLGSKKGAGTFEQKIEFTSSVTGTFYVRIESTGRNFDYAATVVETRPKAVTWGTEADETFHDRKGDDHFQGGDGHDVLIFHGPRAGYEISADEIGATILHDGETDTAREVERFEFDDGALLFDLRAEDVAAVYRLYAAAFARTPDEDGLRFWVEALEDGRTTLPQLADFFTVSDEFAAAYGSDASDTVFIDALYGNVLGRTADADGHAFWLGVFATGEMDRGDMLSQFAESPENVARTEPDLADGIWVV